MCCDHCLRGDSQSLMMSAETIDLALDMFQEIRSLTFTGGEPTLNISAMRYAFNQIKENGIPLGSFFIATNGLENQRELFDLVVDMYGYCYEQEMCEVTVSRDIYHANNEGGSILEVLKCCTDSKHNGDYNGGKSLIKMGRAEGIKGSCSRPITKKLDLDYCSTETMEYGGLLYVSCKGDLLADCDLSYDKIDDPEYQLGKLENIWKFLKRIGD